MTSSNMSPRGENNTIKSHSRTKSTQEKLDQLGNDVESLYDFEVEHARALGKHSKTLSKHTKTLSKHGTSLRWIKLAQADHTVRLQRLETKVDGLETKVDEGFGLVQTQLDTIIGLLGDRARGAHDEV